MDDPRHSRARLIADLFPNEGAPRFAAAAARRRRARPRRVLAAGASLGLAATLLFALLRPAGPAVHRPAPLAGPPAFQIISDDELIAEVSDRPLLATRRADGSRQIIVLDESNR